MNGRQATATRASVLLAFLALPAWISCAGLSAGSFHYAEGDCGNDKAACFAKCDAATPAAQRTQSYCQVANVLVAEEIVRAGAIDPAKVAEARGAAWQLEHVCGAGIARACTALQNLNALLAQKDTSPPPLPAPGGPAQHAQELGARADAARDLAEKAITLDGTDNARQIAHQVRYCNGSEDDCTALAMGLVPTSKVGAFAGLAENYANRLPVGANYGDTSFQPLVERVEKAAQIAMDEAHRILSNRAAEKQKVQAENDAVVAVADECAADLNACKTKCDGGDGTRCTALAIQLWHAPKPNLADAKVTMQKGCDAGVHVACTSSAKIDQEIKAASAQIDSLWSNVTEVGDDLATKRFQIGMMAKVANRPHLVLELQEMKTITAAIPHERYCPARRAFIEATSAAEFTRRATKHCKEEAPSAQGLSGASVTLTDECKQVYATSCP